MNLPPKLSDALAEAQRRLVEETGGDWQSLPSPLKVAMLLIGEALIGKLLDIGWAFVPPEHDTDPRAPRLTLVDYPHKSR